MKAASLVKRAGSFTIAPGREVYGELTLDGDNSLLVLRDDHDFAVSELRYITGTLHDLSKVSLVECCASLTGSGSRGKERYYYAHILPQFVIEGDCHIAATEEVVTEFSFVIDDATTLFHDFDAFGTVIDARHIIDDVVSASKRGRKIAIGPDPIVAYFAGRREIFATDTVLGRISALHHPGYHMPSSKGIVIDNTISVNCQYRRPCPFHAAVSDVISLLRFFAMLVGRPQNIVEFTLWCASAGPAGLHVYWTTPPHRDRSNEWEQPQSSDVLIDPVRATDLFSGVLVRWLERNADWRNARQRFMDCFGKQSFYNVDRLIAAANMFDILPSSAFPAEVTLADELIKPRD